MNDFSQYKIAKLNPEIVKQLASFENSIKKDTGENIVIIAYQKNDKEIHNSN